MEPAPLPPHERTWRHPSEIGPSRAEFERGGQGRTILLAAGTLAAIMVVAMVVAMTPRPGSGPEAISATTKPMLPDPIVAAPDAGGTPIIAAVRAPRLASFAPIPNAVAAVPADAQRDVVVARSLPAARDIVHVTTELVTYRVQWADLAYVELDERALVFNLDGELVARMIGGEIDLLVR